MPSTESCARTCAAAATTCATPPQRWQIALRTAYSQGYPQNTCARTCAGPLLLLSVFPLFSRQKKPRTSLGEGEVRGRIRTARAGSRDLPTLNTTRSIEGLLHPSHALTGALRRKFNANEKKFRRLPTFFGSSISAPRPSCCQRPPRPAAARPAGRPRS